MTLSDVLHAFRWLGIEEAEDIEKTPIVSVHMTKDAVLVNTLARGDDGEFFTRDDSVATNQRTYRIENDL